jgi:hydroxyacyl-ACP dehydratase HTD2-like protein with hotdog domain
MSDINLQDWVGKREEIQDCVYPTPARALALTLNDREFMAAGRRALPELWHWLYFLPLVASAEIGPDGHPKRGGFLPPIALERRMWASGQLTFHQDLRIGDAISKTSEIRKISEKEGKTAAWCSSRSGIRSAPREASPSRKRRTSCICRCRNPLSRHRPTLYPRICNGVSLIRSIRSCCSASRR